MATITEATPSGISNSPPHALRLEPFERYMVADERPDYPMTIWIDITLQGEIDRGAFQASLDETLQRHPLLTARLTRSGRRQAWHWPTRESVTVNWLVPGEPIMHRGKTAENIDLRSEPGIRVWVLPQPGTVRLLIQLHHACADGIGAMQVVGDLLACYGIRTATGEVRRPELAAIAPAQLAQRGKLNIQLPHPLSRWQMLRGTGVEIRKLLGQRTTPLVNHRHSPCPTWDGWPPQEHLLVPPDMFRLLRQAATRHKVSLNDFLLAALFVTLHRRHARVADARPAKRWRVTMPVNLRHSGLQGLSAANVLGYGFITRSDDECSNFDQLVAAVNQDTRFTLDWGLGALFLSAIRTLDVCPGALGAVLRMYGGIATAVFSNLGDFARRFTARFPREEGRVVAGNLILDNLIAAPPVRPGTSAAFCLMSYGDRLNLAVRVDPRLWSRDEARVLLDSFYQTALHLAR